MSLLFGIYPDKSTIQRKKHWTVNRPAFYRNAHNSIILAEGPFKFSNSPNLGL